MMNEAKKQQGRHYEQPTVEVFEVRIEAGFAGSGGESASPEGFGDHNVTWASSQQTEGWNSGAGDDFNEFFN